MLSRVVTKQHDALSVAKIGLREPAIGKTVYRCRITGTQGHAADPIGRAYEVHKTSIHAMRGLRVPTRGGNS